MKKVGNIWSIVLAGGDGTRLSELTACADGRSVPKQFCSVRGGPSLIRQALERARAVAGIEHTVAIVSAEHRRWWSAELGELDAGNIVVQPCNRGTACGLLLPLMRVLGRDPEATVVVLPSDHVVADEETLISAIKAATDHVHEDSNRLVLLGFEPDSPDTGLGWIAPSTSSIRPISGVTRFIEKPSQERAEELLREGALWNSFIFAMRASALFSLFQWSLPWMTRMFSYAFVDRNSGRPWERVSRLYDRLPSVDFSRAVLQEVGKDMRVVAVPPCGWNDVGTPEGVARCTRRCSRHRVAENAPAQTATPALDLAEALREFEEREKGASHAFPL